MKFLQNAFPPALTTIGASVLAWASQMGVVIFVCLKNTTDLRRVEFSYERYVV